MAALKLKIRFEDRPGLVLDVSQVLFHYGLNIVALQLVPNVMFLEIDSYPADVWSALREDLSRIKNVLGVERIADMPYQSREKQIAAIMDSITPAANPLDGFQAIIGESSAIKRAISLARHVANSETTIILRGESGTGKELFAKAIHRSSPRKDKVFVPLNCGALPDHLLESELFGYTEGAFTGAKKSGRVGLFQFAHGGTLFLDEISELPMHLQVKLLRVLQEGIIRPLGSNEEIAVDCRIITATNRNVEELVQKGLFREDLYYRLNVIPIQIPPLRQRKEDIVLLAEHYLQKYSERTGLEKYLLAGATEKLMNHNWYGNVRELENVLERALHLTHGREISSREIVFDGESPELVNLVEKENGECREGLKVTRSRAERDSIVAALKKYGSIRKAAQALGVSHTTIANKVKKYALDSGKIT